VAGTAGHQSLGGALTAVPGEHLEVSLVPPAAEIGQKWWPDLEERRRTTNSSACYGRRRRRTILMASGDGSELGRRRRTTGWP
jgi:hypothetical protein